MARYGYTAKDDAGKQDSPSANLDKQKDASSGSGDVGAKDEVIAEGREQADVKMLAEVEPDIAGISLPEKSWRTKYNDRAFHSHLRRNYAHNFLPVGKRSLEIYDTKSSCLTP